MAFVSAATSPQDLQYGGCRWFKFSAELKRAPKMFKDPAGDLRFRTGIGAKAGANQTHNFRHGIH